MKKLIAYILIGFLLTLSISCGGGGNDDPSDPGNPENPTPELGVFNLSTPENNSLCVEGDYTIQGNLNHIMLTWAPSKNAESYKVYLTDNETNETTSHTSLASSAEVDVAMGHSYSWEVEAFINEKSLKSKEKWSFYSRGEKVESYAPFPAEITLSDNGDETIDILWETSDLDTDVTGYDVYFGTDPEPPLLVDNLEVGENQIQNQSIVYNTTYHLKIISHDQKGNSSTSHKEFNIQK